MTIGHPMPRSQVQDVQFLTLSFSLPEELDAHPGWFTGAARAKYHKLGTMKQKWSSHSFGVP
jgi:hypothetical protein